MTRPTHPPVQFLNFEKMVEDKLRDISTTHPSIDFYSDVNFKKGFIDSYFEDIASSRGNLGFPLVCAAYTSDSYESKSNFAAINHQSITITAAVKIGRTPEDTNLRLAEIATDIKVALCNPNLTIVSCKYSIPEGEARFAVLEMLIKINTNETWGSYDD